ncbi:FG-GAP repeat domain-containing protein [Streptomyces sp. NBC_00503]|uniref:FG-GAP repeat domain-containing protein n=1 Tax=Streptomyces sp. NBC_00503 TaxID=2903659 RepID=UPI002E806F4F|nr:VCBS repeat-containing protein [Streptomyces sp. NBC_00503]WUD80046.1 VCBS repeat-containing protein [Streptomyces sp. NBC_00503]
MVRAEDGRANSGWSGVCRFIVDQNVPSTPPDINSPEFPNGAGGKPEHTSPARTEGSFTFTPGQATGVKKYEYWSEWSQQRVTKDAEADGRLAVRLTPPAAGPARIYARSLTAGGNPSDVQTYLFYANTPDIKGVPGDLNGDGNADLYALESAGRLRMYAGIGDGTVSKWREASGLSLAGSLITHRGDWTDNGYEDLVATIGAKGSRTAHVFPNNGYGYACSRYEEQAPDAVCTDERRDLRFADQADDHIRDADQILAVGDVDGGPEEGVPGYPDLFVKENGLLWLYFGSPSGYLDDNRDPVLIGEGNWSDFDLASPGDRTGNGFADLMTRHRSTGDLRLLESTGPSIDGLGGPAAGTLIGDSWTAANRPLLTAAQDADGDGRPDLWATTGTGGLQFYPNATGRGTQVGSGSWEVLSQLS